MKIAFFELDYHYTDIVSFCNLMLKTDYEITIYTSFDLFKRLESQNFISRYNWIIKKKDVNVAAFLALHKSQINDNDLIYFSTIASGYSAFYKFDFNPKTVLRIHNANAYLNPFKNIHFEFSYFYFRKALYYLWNDIIKQNSFYYIPKLVNKIDFITFPELSIQNYVLENRLIPKEKIFRYIPVSFPNFKKISTQNTLHISVIGLIDERKRDYLSVLEAFKIVAPKLNKNINLTILGKPVGKYGLKVISKFKTELKSEKLTVTVFDTFIPQDVFELELEKTNLILAPVQEQLVFGIFNEYCSKTKTTGSLSDMIRMGIPLLMPQNIDVEPNLKPYVESYSTPLDLANILLDYSENRTEITLKTEKLRSFLLSKYQDFSYFDDF
ncbi:MAG: hypothetical protein EAZ53_11500 [Bacteroidetes bacterium]|nr:MAG: hypothetical protein EAZ53_11500 [Bacteroidota bacterium]